MADAQFPPSGLTQRVHTDASAWRWLRVVLFGIATLLAAYLAYSSFRGGPIAGCGPASACSRVLQSRWAYWLGIPVSVPALAVYGALLVAGLRRGVTRGNLREQADPLWVAILSAGVIAAALWFVLLQAVVFRAFCLLCMTTHLSATAGAVLVLLDAMRAARTPGGRRNPVYAATGVGMVVGLIGLIAGQVFVAPRMHGVSRLPASAVSSATAGERVLKLHDGQFQLDLRAFPSLGSLSAPHVVVCLFDYTCSHCRDMHSSLDQAQRPFGDQLMILLLPVPLDSRCNHLVAQTSAENVGACDYARLALAVWLAQPREFAAFHSAMFSPARPPPVDVARAEAERLVGKAPLERALGDPRIASGVRLGVDLFQVNSRRAGASQLPQLMLKKSVSVGPIHDIETLRQMLLEEIGPRTD